MTTVAEITDNGSGTEYSLADALGRRVEKTINGVTTMYLYDGLDIIMEMDANGAPTASYIRSLNIDEPLARVELGSGAVRYYLADALGSITALTDENGVVKTSYSYDPFGSVAVSGEASDNPFMFVGKENDGTGLMREGYRYYSFDLQRYISEDPIGLAGGDVNYYARVGNNPVNWIDPLGLEGQTLPPPGLVNHPSFEAYIECTKKVNAKECREKLKDCIDDCKSIPEACSNGEPLKDVDAKGANSLQGICELGCYGEYIGCMLSKTPGTIHCELQNPAFDMMFPPPVGNPDFKIP